MSVRQLAIYGAGGFAREVLCLVEDINRERPTWEVVGFLDDHPVEGREVNGLPVLGGAGWLEERRGAVSVTLGVGSPAAKRRIIERLRPVAPDMPALVHPNVVRSRFVELGAGVIVTAGNILTTQVLVEDFVTLNLACTVGHDVTLGRFTTVAPGVNVSGNVQIGQGCDVGTGSKIIQGVAIGEWSIVGAGAVVARPLPANCTAVGVPAKVIKEREPGWQEQ